MWTYTKDIILFAIPVFVILELMVLEGYVFQKKALRDKSCPNKIEVLATIDQLIRERKKNRRLFIVYFMIAIAVKLIYCHV